MNNFLPIKRNHRAAPLRLAARIISIMILAFLWPVGGGAQEQTPSDLNVSNITDATTLTYKKKSGSDTYAWYYNINSSSDIEFTGTLTGTNSSSPQITIKSEKEATSPDYADCATLKLNGASLTATGNADVFGSANGSKPFLIQAIGESASTLKYAGSSRCSAISISHTDFLLDGGKAGLDILATGTYGKGIDLGYEIKAILKGKITVKTEGGIAVLLGSSADLSATEDATVMISSENKAIYGDSSPKVTSPFLQWTFGSAPTNSKTLEIKDANGNSLNPAIKFTTDGKAKSFAVSIKKNTGYALWLNNEQQEASDRIFFRATDKAMDNKLIAFTGIKKYTLPADWPGYGKYGDVGTNGTDVSVSGTTYTVNTARGLAWIAWVTNNAKTTANTGETYTDYYPASSGFKDCTVKLNDDISLAKPNNDVSNNFEDNWIPIGFAFSDVSLDWKYNFTKSFQGTFDGNNKTISGMTISSTSVYYTGLFGCLYGATVKNLTMSDEAGSNNIKLTTLTSTVNIYPLGSIAGYVENGKIINCHNQCAITYAVDNNNKRGDLGGIVGTIKGSVVSACSNSGTIKIEKGDYGSAGGIVGVNDGSSTIVSCFNKGAINSVSIYAGGILGSNVGDSYANSSSILHCYSTGDMTVNAAQSSASGGIVGGALNLTIESCFATGFVSAESSGNSNYPTRYAIAGGIIGWVWSDGSITVKDCLALNTGGVKATGNTSDKHAGRIVGYNKNDNATFSNNYASTKIQLTVGDNPSTPTANIAADAINGADLYLDEAAAVTASWAGSENTKAFTAIGTDADGKLPQLKTIASYGNEGLPVTYGEAIPGQSAASLPSADYLAMPGPLPLPVSDTDVITLSYFDGKWSYKKGEGETSTRFNGTVKMTQDGATSTNKLVISTATGNPTLTFEKVAIKPTDGAALTINEGCALTINIADEGTSTLSSSGASTLVNKGFLTLTGKGLYIGNTGTTDTHYGLDNSGTFTVTDPSSTSVTFHCAGTAIHNTGTGKLGNAWMEWQFAEAPGDDGKIAFAATDDDNQSPAAQLRQGKTFATTVTAGKTYRLWTVTNNGDEARTPQKGLDANGTPVKLFSAVTNAVTVYTAVEELKTIEITDAKNFSAASCAAQDVVVKPNGKLTVDADNAFVFNLTLESGAQLVTTKPLNVSETFNMPTRMLENKWITFGSPVALTASVGNESNLLCAATGYTSTSADSQGWMNIPGTDKNGTTTAALAADTPYLLAAKTGSTTVTFIATASANKPIEIPKTATVTLGDALPNGTFLFQANPNLANLTLSGIYVLNADGTRFELKETEYEVKPFEAFIVANAVTRARVASLKIGEGIATGIEQPLAAVTARVWGTRETLHISANAPADVVIVTPAGRLLRTLKVSAGDTTVALPAGIYFVRCNDITYKVSL